MSWQHLRDAEVVVTHPVASFNQVSSSTRIGDPSADQRHGFEER
jgi:hypothetical protein